MEEKENEKEEDVERIEIKKGRENSATYHKIWGVTSTSSGAVYSSPLDGDAAFHALSPNDSEL